MDQCTPDALTRHNEATGLNGQKLFETSSSAEVERKVKEIRRVYGENYRYLVQYARNRVDSLEGAQDIVQQAFTNTLIAIERGAEIRSMSGFLHRCVHNLCINASRRDPPLALDEELCLLTERSAAASVEEQERWREVEGVVDQLAPSQRYAFLMAEVKGYGYDEIAQSMDRSVESVRQLLSRARRIIRAKADGASDWLGGTIALPGLSKTLAPRLSGRTTGAATWVRNKATEMQTWFGSYLQRSLEALVQPSTSVIAGVAVVAVVAVQSPPTAEQIPPATGHSVSNVSESGHSVVVIDPGTDETRSDEATHDPISHITQPKPESNEHADTGVERDTDGKEDGAEDGSDISEGMIPATIPAGESAAGSGGLPLFPGNDSPPPVPNGGGTSAGESDGGVPLDGEGTIFVDDDDKPGMGLGEGGDQRDVSGAGDEEGLDIGIGGVDDGVGHSDDGEDAGENDDSSGLTGQTTEEQGSNNL